jgi:enoyl-CoA hydratase/carnithine racemase
MLQAITYRRFSPVSRVFSSLSSAHQSKIPQSAHSIPTLSQKIGDAGAAIREVGTCRRVFLLKPHLSLDEIEGLAFRIKAMSNNTSLSSILIATTDDDDVASGALPSSVFELDTRNISSLSDDYVHYFSGGYDALDVWKKGKHNDVSYLQQLMDAVSDLSIATRGNSQQTKIPIITLPHGFIHDAGYAFCMGGYVIATPNTSFKITNPSKGLSFDPVGLSFILTRLGWEYQQNSADYVGCGLLLALTGIEAKATDMIETGLATSLLENLSLFPSFERQLGDVLPWELQTILPPAKRLFGEKEPESDINARYRNVTVAKLIKSYSHYNLAAKTKGYHKANDDPSIDLKDNDPFAQGSSYLVNLAITFDDIFKEESSVAGIMEQLRQVSEREATNQESKDATDVAKMLYGRMKQQSPLALNVVYDLMVRASSQGETLESCMEREKRVQIQMFQQPDFELWAKENGSKEEETTVPPHYWKYASPSDVPKDLVDEIIGE